MKQFRKFLDFIFFVICVLLILSAAISVRGEEVPKREAKPFTIAQDRFEINGTVVDTTPDLSEEKIAKLEASKTVQDFIQTLTGITGILQSCSVPNLVVTAQSKSVMKKVVTDSQGKFNFAGLPDGVYEVYAAMPSQPSGTGIKRMATAKEWVRLDYNRRVDLRLRVDFVAVKGRITDVHGRPIAGAEVNAIEKIYDQQHIENHDPRTWSAISKADGSYELQELEPANLYRIAGYLSGGYLRALNCVDIHVKADGFVQDKEDVPRVPLVTEELLGPARRLLKAESQMATRNGGPELREKDGLSFPASHGNTITGVDIVLKKAGEGAQ